MTARTAKHLYCVFSKLSGNVIDHPQPIVLDFGPTDSLNIIQEPFEPLWEIVFVENSKPQKSNLLKRMRADKCSRLV